MGLKELKFGSDTVETPGGNFAVRGINVDDLRSIIRENSDEISLLVKAAEDTKTAEDSGGEVDYTKLVGAALHVAPNLVAHVIARASDEGDDAAAIKAARKLPLDVQVIAIDKIGRLTFASEGGPKKVIEIVMKMVRSTSALKKGLDQ